MAHILVADDEPDIRQLIAFTLQLGGHEITQAANGSEAVELTQQTQPDLIIMDVRMPKMNGYEACQIIKKTEDTQHIPIVFLSAKGQDEDVTAGITIGAVAYIVKPFSPQELMQHINDILNNTDANT
jgi:CheY-like chemotaxis protein